MKAESFPRVFLGLSCFAVLIGGEVKKHSQLCCTAAVQPCQDNSTGDITGPGKKEINIGAFVPFLRDDRYGHSTAMKMAINLINNRSDILNNYTLVLDIEDTAWGSGAYATEALFKLLNKKEKPVILLGPSNTAALEPVAEAAPLWNLIQVSYLSGSPKFESVLKYANTYRAAPSSTSYSKAKVAFIKYYGWKRVAILHQYDPEFFSPTVAKLKIELNKNNISIIAVEGFEELGDISFQMDKLKSLDARIIIGEFSYVGARNVFCETSESFWSEMVRLNKNKRLRKLSAYAFDAAWVIALTLDAALADGMKYENLLQRTYKEVHLMRKWTKNTNFQGITGPVRFDQKRERVGTVLVLQNRGGNYTRIGEHSTFSDELRIFESPKDSIWQGNKPPKDHTDRNLEFMMIQLPLMIIMWLIAAIGIICSSSFLYFNISNGTNRIIKMSSSKLNNIIIMGCILCYASVVLLGLDARFLNKTAYGNICNARTAVLSIGFSLSFGAMFSKTWRVHKIFTAAKFNKKMAIKDLHLLVTVAGLLAVDVVFVASWIAIDPLQAEILTFKEMMRKQQDSIIIPALYQCTSRYKTYFLGALFAYKGILLLFGLFLAWETRNVTIPALNDSRYIGMSVYNVVVLSIIGAIVAIAVDGSMYYEASYAISSLCMIVCTTVTLLLVFVPKIYQFCTKDEAATQRIHVCGDINLMEGQISNCKATQTDFNVPQSAANEGFSSSDEISYERNGDMPVDAETMVVAFSSQTCEVAIITECNAGASSNI